MHRETKRFYTIFKLLAETEDVSLRLSVSQNDMQVDCYECVIPTSLVGFS